MKHRYGEVSASIFTGIAHFDGFDVRSDPITDPRRDRVLPVMEEEQIFMCRQMDRRLRRMAPGALALDVGTGSGVFAIWAAARGCRVFAIDVSPRAVAMTADNARRNGIRVVRHVRDLEPGTICVKRQTFAPRFVADARFRHAFDVVFLNPPYNPTCPSVHVAIHAESGEDAQRAFREQIVLAPHVLKPRGWCFGNQMTVGKPGDWDALRWMNRSFRRSQIGWCDILDEPGAPAEVFLRGQYHSYLGRTDRGRPTAADVSEYVARVSAAYPFFGLIYYEINKLQGVDGGQRRLPRCFRPKATWRDRVVLHRAIVEASPSAPKPPTKARHT